MAKELMDIKKMKEDAVAVLAKAKKTEKGNIIHTSTQTERLKVDLTQNELLQAGEDLAEALRALSSLEEDKKSYVASIAAKIKEQEGIAATAQGLVQNKYDFRPTDCVEVKDNTTGKKFRVRMDTEEVISEGKMTADERQSKFTWGEDEEEKKLHTAPMTNNNPRLGDE